MRWHTGMSTIAAISVALGSTAMAAVPSAAIRNQTPLAHSTAPAQQDCQKLGSDVSALIDQRRDSPNVAQARAVFQLGVMECMEGDDVVADQRYVNAKKLLAENFPAR